MASPPSELSIDATEKARRLYEDSRVPLKEVAAQLGLSRRSLFRRARSWGWVRQRPDVPPRPVPRRALIARLVTRIEAEIAAVERLVARAGLVAQGGAGEAGVAAGTAASVAADTERAARTLAVLVRSLRELAALERGEDNEIDDEEMPRDAGAYRRELAATLERVLADRAA